MQGAVVENKKPKPTSQDNTLLMLVLRRAPALLPRPEVVVLLLPQLLEPEVALLPLSATSGSDWPT